MTDNPSTTAAMKFVVTEEPSKCDGRPSTLFYAREQPFRPGRSIQLTGTSREAVEWQIKRIMNEGHANAAT